MRHSSSPRTPMAGRLGPAVAIVAMLFLLWQYFSVAQQKAELQSALQGTSADLEATRTKFAALNRERQELGDTIESCRQEKKQLRDASESAARESKEQLDDLQKQQGDLATNIEKARAQAETCKLAKENVEKELATATDEREDCKNSLAVAMQQNSKAEAEAMSALEKARDAAIAERAALEERLAKAEAAGASRDQECAVLATSLKESVAAHDKLVAQVTQLSAELAAAKAAAAAAAASGGGAGTTGGGSVMSPALASTASITFASSDRSSTLATNVHCGCHLTLRGRNFVAVMDKSFKNPSTLCKCCYRDSARLMLLPEPSPPARPPPRKRPASTSFDDDMAAACVLASLLSRSSSTNSVKASPSPVFGPAPAPAPAPRLSAARAASSDAGACGAGLLAVLGGPAVLSVAAKTGAGGACDAISARTRAAHALTWGKSSRLLSPTA
eukprot:m.140897 g.140897  ORF g.140897 m.140897 type:complete len:446 (+) comp14957_c5_seq2:35-1372(+)